MNCKDLVDKGYVESTGNGKRIDIQIRVYPEGFGQIILRRRKSPVQPIELMCNNVCEAKEYLRQIWDCLQAQDLKVE